MTVRSAGILLFRRTRGVTEVWIAHMGGPFWAKKDAAAWSIPKGEYADDEEPLAAALREFAEEVGVAAPAFDYRLLGEFRQASGKIVTAFTAEGEFQIDEVRSNTFDAEWPPRSGRIQRFPEIDRGGWFTVDDARAKLVKGQLPMLDALQQHIADS